jgi:Ran GTPase-activating protein (RanGAP) involved in mRNA processing and transport
MAKFVKFGSAAIVESMKLFGKRRGTIQQLTTWARENVVGFDKEEFKVIQGRVNSALNARKAKFKKILANSAALTEAQKEAVENALAALTVKVNKKGRQPENLSLLVSQLQDIDMDDETDDETESDAELDETEDETDETEPEPDTE